MFALSPRSRALLAGAALASFAAAFASTPIVARGAAGIAPLDPIHSPAPSSPTPLLAVAPRRDPFAGGVESAPASPPPAYPGDGRTLPATPATVVPLPPNLGAPTIAGGGAMRVTAIITGAHPSALVDENGTARIITVGDTFAGARVTRIDVRGVRLGNGFTLAVAAADATPPPSLPMPPLHIGGRP